MRITRVSVRTARAIQKMGAAMLTWKTICATPAIECVVAWSRFSVSTPNDARIHLALACSGSPVGVRK